MMNLLGEDSLQFLPLGAKEPYFPKNTAEALAHVRRLILEIESFKPSVRVLLGFKEIQLSKVRSVEEMLTLLESTALTGDRRRSGEILSSIRIFLSSPLEKWIHSSHISWANLPDDETAFVWINQKYLTLLVQELVQDPNSKKNQELHSLKNEIIAEKLELAEHNLAAKRFVDRIESTISEKSLDLEESVKALSINARDEITAFKAQFEESTRLTAVGSFWSTKASQHSVLAMTWFWIFLGAIISLFLGFTLIVYFFGSPVSAFVSELAKKADPSSFNIATIALLTFATFLIVWPLKHVSRMFLDNWALEKDAQQRSAMHQTYLALVGHPRVGITPEERVLVLSAMFRPSTSSGGDDAMPTSVVEYLTKLLDSRTKT